MKKTLAFALFYILSTNIFADTPIGFDQLHISKFGTKYEVDHTYPEVLQGQYYYVCDINTPLEKGASVAVTLNDGKEILYMDSSSPLTFKTIPIEVMVNNNQSTMKIAASGSNITSNQQYVFNCENFWKD